MCLCVAWVHFCNCLCQLAIRRLSISSTNSLGPVFQSSLYSGRALGARDDFAPNMSSKQDVPASVKYIHFSSLVQGCLQTTVGLIKIFPADLNCYTPLFQHRNKSTPGNSLGLSFPSKKDLRECVDNWIPWQNISYFCGKSWGHN